MAKEHIVAGDIFQVVLAQRYDLDLDADPFDVYRVLRQVNPSPYMYFVRHPALTIVGSSPEPMVQVQATAGAPTRVISRPIAGTRRRGATDAHDRRMAAELTEHPKERAEHVMLVDLARNDVGRVARFGSVHVDELMTLERYSHVMHLTSQVSGDLVDGLSPIDVLRATLPAGTVSGAPKVRAMEIIDDLEPVRRGAYAGVVGYVDWSGNLDTAIAIRTMFCRPDGASVQAGAGIVADSVPDDEDLECRNKAAALLAAVPAARRMTRPRRPHLTSPRSGSSGISPHSVICAACASNPSLWPPRDPGRPCLIDQPDSAHRRVCVPRWVALETLGWSERNPRQVAMRARQKTQVRRKTRPRMAITGSRRMDTTISAGNVVIARSACGSSFKLAVASGDLAQPRELGRLADHHRRRRAGRSWLDLDGLDDTCSASAFCVSRVRTSSYEGRRVGADPAQPPSRQQRPADGDDDEERRRSRPTPSASSPAGPPSPRA